MSLIKWNPDDRHANIVLLNNNLTVDAIGAEYKGVRALASTVAGKYYFEVEVDTVSQRVLVGLANDTVDTRDSYGSGAYNLPLGVRGLMNTGRVYSPETGVIDAGKFAAGDVVGILFDRIAGAMEIRVNNSTVHIENLPLGGNWTPYVVNYRTSDRVTANFGATPFKYPVPGGYLPYDVENAEWFIPNKYLIRQDNKVLTIESDTLIETVLQEPLAREDFEELGFNNLDLLLGKELSNMTLLINPPAETTATVSVKAVPEPQLIIPNGDIVLKMLDKIYNFTLYSNKNSSGDVRIIFSVDEGVNWLTYNLDTGEFEEIDINRFEEVKEKGVDPDTFNSIGLRWNGIILDSKIRFAYYLEMESINDIAEVDKLEIEMDMHGRWKKARHGQDYHYKYDNEHLYVSFFKDGSYKINYQG